MALPRRQHWLLLLLLLLRCFCCCADRAVAAAAAGIAVADAVVLFVSERSGGVATCARFDGMIGHSGFARGIPTLRISWSITLAAYKGAGC